MACGKEIRLSATRSFKAGFSPTVDCAVLVAAAEKGFATDEGLSLELSKASSPRELLDAWEETGLHGLHLHRDGERHQPAEECIAALTDLLDRLDIRRPLR